MNLSYGLTGFPLMPMTLAGPVRQASAAHTVEISWSRSGFRARIDGVMAKRAVYLPAAAQHAPPDHAHVFVWVQHRDSAKPVRLTPRLSLVRAQSVLFCQRCQRHHSLHQLSWERCLFCSAWLCQRHAGSPFCSECEHDYAGGTAALPQDVWSFVPLLHFAAAFPDLACLQATCQRLRAILLEERTWTAATLRIGLAKGRHFARQLLASSRLCSRVYISTQDMLQIAAPFPNLHVEWPVQSKSTCVPIPMLHFRTLAPMWKAASLRVSLPHSASQLVVGLKASQRADNDPGPCWIEVRENRCHQLLEISTGQDDASAAGIWDGPSGFCIHRIRLLDLRWTNDSLSLFVDGLPAANVRPVQVALWSYVYFHCFYSTESGTLDASAVELLPVPRQDVALPRCNQCEQHAVSCCTLCHAWLCEHHALGSRDRCAVCSCGDRRGGATLSDAGILSCLPLLVQFANEMEVWLELQQSSRELKCAFTGIVPRDVVVALTALPFTALKQCPAVQVFLQRGGGNVIVQHKHLGACRDFVRKWLVEWSGVYVYVFRQPKMV